MHFARAITWIRQSRFRGFFVEVNKKPLLHSTSHNLDTHTPSFFVFYPFLFKKKIIRPYV